MRKLWLGALVATMLSSFAVAQNVGNPRPGYPHDTINIHVLADHGNPKGCVNGGGHSLFLRYDPDTGEVLPANIFFTMIDWVQLDNDDDDLFDEDPSDGIDNDGDLLVDEDGDEPGKSTNALDCDAWSDGEVSLRIRDADPRQGVITTQEWFIRGIGRPETNFAFTSLADQVTCTLTSDPDGIPDSGDEVVECSYGEPGDWIELASFNLKLDGCVKQVKLGGQNPTSGGGKTPFCDATEGFLVDVDETGDGTVDLFDQFIFSVSCLDVEGTTVNESESCPLSRIIWDVDEEETTSKAKAQIFVAHTGTANIKGGKISKP